MEFFDFGSFLGAGGDLAAVSIALLMMRLKSQIMKDVTEIKEELVGILHEHDKRIALIESKSK